MISDSYIGRSGQLWKIWIAAFLLVIGFLMLLFGFSPTFQNRQSFGAGLALAGVGLSTLGFVWACLSVKCRKCSARIVWKAMREQPHNKWLNWLLINKTCPYCRDRSED